MGKLRKDESGFSVVEVVLVLVIIVLVGVVGWFVYNNHTKKTTASVTPTVKTSTSQTKIPTTSVPVQAVSPQDFVKSVLVSLSSSDETRLGQYLSPSFKVYRQTNLATDPCAGKTITNPSVLFCGSSLNPTVLSSLTPIITDMSFKSGQKGKSVDYKITQTANDPGVTYFSFKLLPDGESWQLNDFGDLFVPSGTTAPNPIPGHQGS